MKFTTFHWLVVLLFSLLLALMGYQYYNQNGLDNLLLLGIIGMPLFFVLLMAFYYSNIDSLFNSDFRHSKLGREKWQKKLDELVNDDEKS